ncbi:follistatin-related protein 1-like [Tigriopus californicus]|uniref:follistatin-related protein 1-like n=1 Tax=Tigriopus californicus TaxID=6832 RepID=UPI0027DAB4C2|nr:follistatin-related protein 1-like [Tigriopus californicus]
MEHFGVFTLALLSLWISSILALDPVSLCHPVKCRPGRECRVLSSGSPACVCRSKCPPTHHKGSHRRRHVCGSDGMMYESHCQLHREACLRGIHIHAKKHDHSCSKDPLIQLKSLIQKAADEVKAYDESHIVVPIACHQNERNRMREFLISWMSLTAEKQPWYNEDMGYHQIVYHHLNTSDKDRNGFVDSIEWLKYIERNKTYQSDNVKKQIQQQKLLCLDALVEEGDRDQDWRLSKQEFIQLMSHDYEPSNKYCRMDRKRYEDGTKTKVDCNGCVCSCGKWICTSQLCSSSKSDQDDSDSTVSTTEPSSTVENLEKELERQLQKALSDDVEMGDDEIFTYDDMDNMI